MIVVGASRRSVSFWSKHLANDKKNDRAELKDIRGLAATNLKDALLEMEQDAQQTRCINFFYQANFNPTSNERLTEEQWERAFQIFEKHRGIPEGQPRIVYEHEKKGRVHRHVIWSRVILETMRAWPDSLDAKICHAASREISEELGLARSISPYDKDREGPRPERAPKSYEMFRGLKSGLDPRDITAEVTQIYRDSMNGPDFVAGLEEHGYVLIRGDRRSFCILDSAGDVHSLARRIEGVRSKELREFLKDIEPHSLPTVDEARERHRAKVNIERGDELDSIQKTIAWEDALAKAAIEKEKIERRFVEPRPRIAAEENQKVREAFKDPRSRRHINSKRFTNNALSIATTGARPLGKSLNISGKVLDSVTDALDSLFSPKLSPREKARGEAATAEREENAQSTIEKQNQAATIAQMRHQEEKQLREVIRKDRGRDR